MTVMAFFWVTNGVDPYRSCLFKFARIIRRIARRRRLATILTGCADLAGRATAVA